MKKTAWLVLALAVMGLSGCDNRSESEKALDAMKKDASNAMDQAKKDINNF